MPKIMVCCQLQVDALRACLIEQCTGLLERFMSASLVAARFRPTYSNADNCGTN